MLCMSSLLLLGSCRTQESALAKNEIYMLVGSYSAPAEEGVKVYRFNEMSGEATYLSGLKGVPNPSFLAPTADGKLVYSVGEGGKSTAHTLSFDKATGYLALLNTQETGSSGPCHINLSPKERFVVTANYMGGSITVFPLDENRLLGADKQVIPFKGSSVNPNRQRQPHLHCIMFSPDGKILLANDLGTDRVHTFPLHEDEATLLREGELIDIPVKPGSGPRHLAFHPNGRFAYLINELSGQVTTFGYKDGRLDPLQYIASDTVNAQGSADIHLSPDGRFLYASNRLKADGIAIFSVDKKTGLLTRIGYQPTGIHPRNFALSPDGSYLLVACRDTHEIQIFHRNPSTGLLNQVGRIETHSPVCVKFVK